LVEIRNGKRSRHELFCGDYAVVAFFLSIRGSDCPLQGTRGFVFASAIILSGCIVFWFVEKKTERSLDKDSFLNQILNKNDTDA